MPDAGYLAQASLTYSDGTKCNSRAIPVDTPNGRIRGGRLTVSLIEPREQQNTVDGSTTGGDVVRLKLPITVRSMCAAPAQAGLFYIDFAKTSPDMEILCGGGCDNSTGYFIEPTVVLSKDPQSKLMVEEIFGPVLTVYVYPENEYDETLQLCDQTSPYALTGAIFARDRGAIVKAMDSLRHAAGNFYINDKPTGAIVGQQPFGGSRASGTNDKAGSKLNLLRWVSTRTIKETFVPPTDYRYPFLGPDA